MLKYLIYRKALDGKELGRNQRSIEKLEEFNRIAKTMPRVTVPVKMQGKY
jgi:hypothetical protein